MSVAGPLDAPLHSSGAMYGGVPGGHPLARLHRDAEVGQRAPALGVDQHVLRLEVMVGAASECAAASPSSESFSTTSAASARVGPRRVIISRSETPRPAPSRGRRPGRVDPRSRISAPRAWSQGTSAVRLSDGIPEQLGVADDQVLVEVLDRHPLAGRLVDRRHDPARYPAAQQPFLGVPGNRPPFQAGLSTLGIDRSLMGELLAGPDACPVLLDAELPSGSSLSAGTQWACGPADGGTVHATAVGHCRGLSVIAPCGRHWLRRVTRRLSGCGGPLSAV